MWERRIDPVQESRVIDVRNVIIPRQSDEKLVRRKCHVIDFERLDSCFFRIEIDWRVREEFCRAEVDAGDGVSIIASDVKERKSMFSSADGR